MINTVRLKYGVLYGVLYIQVCGGGIVRILSPLLYLQRYKIWRLLLNEDSEAFVVSLLLKFV